MEINFSARNLCQALKKPSNKITKISDKNNPYLWQAYSIYDQILDQKQRTEDLPLANICLIKYLKNLEKIQGIIKKTNLKIGKKFKKTSYQILLDMEKANQREKENKASPKMLRASYLSQKSLGQCLPSLAVISFYQKEKIKNIISFHINYLAARQLADDLYDLAEDEKNQVYNPLLFYKKRGWSLEKICNLTAKKIISFCDQAKKDINFLEDKEKLLQPISLVYHQSKEWLKNKNT